MNRRVVITGMGAVTPLGNNVKTFWDSIKKGVCGIGPITAYDTSETKVKLAAEVKIDPSEYLPPADIKKMDSFTVLAMIAANEALEDSGISCDNADPNRCGVLVSSGIGG